MPGASAAGKRKNYVVEDDFEAVARLMTKRRQWPDGPSCAADVLAWPKWVVEAWRQHGAEPVQSLETALAISAFLR
eukprot:3923668-Lingulodinium_polyedra.AAC.1